MAAINNVRVSFFVAIADKFLVRLANAALRARKLVRKRGILGLEVRDHVVKSANSHVSVKAHHAVGFKSLVHVRVLDFSRRRILYADVMLRIDREALEFAAGARSFHKCQSWNMLRRSLLVDEFVLDACIWISEISDLWIWADVHLMIRQ